MRPFKYLHKFDKIVKQTHKGELKRNIEIYTISTGFQDLDTFLGLDDYLIKDQSIKSYTASDYGSDFGIIYKLDNDGIKIRDLYGNELANFLINKNTLANLQKFRDGCKILVKDHYEYETENINFVFKGLSIGKLRIVIVSLHLGIIFNYHINYDKLFMKSYTDIINEILPKFRGISVSSVINDIIYKSYVRSYEKSDRITYYLEINADHILAEGWTTHKLFKYSDIKELDKSIIDFICSGILPLKYEIENPFRYSKRARNSDEEALNILHLM